MDFKDFDLEVNPYDLLGVPRGCRDLKEIKRAYRKKSLLYHPDRGKDHRRPEVEFPTLHKCYIYLKTLCMELDGDFLHDINPEDKMSDLRSQYDARNLPGDARYNNGNGQVHNGDGQGHNGGHQSGGTQRQRKPDFEKPVIDNSIIGEDALDHDRILAEMMSYRPASTSYQDIGGYGGETVPDNIFKGNRRFNLNQFNEHFEQRQQQGNVGASDCLTGFTGFDELGGAATIVSDGQYMFVQGSQRVSSGENGDESAAYGPVCSFGLLKEHAEYDRNLEKERYSSLDNGFVSDKELQKFSRMYDTCGDSASKKLNKAQFADRMRFMQAQHQENLITQKQRHQQVVQEQMNRLSDLTRANLQNHLLIDQ